MSLKIVIAHVALPFVVTWTSSVWNVSASSLRFIHIQFKRW